MSDESHRAAARSAGRRHPFFWAAVAMAVAVLGVYAFAARSYLTYGPRIVDFGWTAAPDDVAWYVSGVQPALTGGKLVPGDRIVTVTSARGEFSSPVSLVTAGIRPGDSYMLKLVRGGETLDVTLT